MIICLKFPYSRRCNFLLTWTPGPQLSSLPVSLSPPTHVTTRTALTEEAGRAVQRAAVGCADWYCDSLTQTSVVNRLSRSADISHCALLHNMTQCITVTVTGAQA